MSRTFQALERAEAERRARLALRATAERVAPGGTVSLSRFARAREPVSWSATRAEAAALQATLGDRLWALERRVGALDETVTKQWAELEPRLLHVLQLATKGLGREVERLAAAREAPASEGPRARRPAALAGLPPWILLAGFGLGALSALFGRTCAG